MKGEKGLKREIQIGTENKIREFLHEKVQAYNKPYFEQANFENLSVIIRNEEKVIGGSAGILRGDWLLIQELWVDENYRRQQLGSEILKTIEEKAQEKGCSHVLLDTFEFQAPEFYKKKGYEEVFVYQEHQITGKHYYLSKKL